MQTQELTTRNLLKVARQWIDILKLILDANQNPKMKKLNQQRN
jgi:hypothetical protein